VGAGELAAEEFDEAAGARAAVGAEQAHAIEEHEELEDFGVFRVALGILRGGLLGFVEKRGESVVETMLNGRNWRLLIDDAGGKCFVGFGERLERGEDVWVGGGGLRGTKFGDGESDGGKKLRMDANEIGSEADIEQRGVGGELTRVLFLVTMGRDQVGAVGRAVEGDFAFGAATDGADGFGFGRTEAAGLAFLTDRTGHGDPLNIFVKRNYEL